MRDVMKCCQHGYKTGQRHSSIERLVHGTCIRMGVSGTHMLRLSIGTTSQAQHAAVQCFELFQGQKQSGIDDSQKMWLALRVEEVQPTNHFQILDKVPRLHNRIWKLLAGIMLLRVDPSLAKASHD